MNNNFFNKRYRQSFFKKGHSESKKIEIETLNTNLINIKDYKNDDKTFIKNKINEVNDVILNTISNSQYSNDAIIKKMKSANN